jgi:cation transport ATPase
VYPDQTEQREPSCSTQEEDAVLLEVGGMHCASCCGRVQHLLEAQQHVTRASVSLVAEVALVRISIPPIMLPDEASGEPGALQCSFAAPNHPPSWALHSFKWLQWL